VRRPLRLSIDNWEASPHTNVLHLYFGVFSVAGLVAIVIRVVGATLQIAMYHFVPANTIALHEA
jgi:hypothetical protein